MDFWLVAPVALVSLLICAGVGAALGSQNGHGGAGFVLGLLFGPIGIVITLLLPDQATTVSTVSSETSVGVNKELLRDLDLSAASRTCPDCAESIKLRASVCRFCGRRFSDEEVAAAVEAARRSHETAREELVKRAGLAKACPDCGSLEVYPDWTGQEFCPACRKYVSRSSE